MSKAYLFAVILLATSLTGCIESGDELEKSTSPNEEEDILEPVGTNGNETVSHDELIAEIANLTEQVKELNEQIAVLSDDLQSLEYYQYNPPENSTIYLYHFNYDTASRDISFIITKTGNSVHINYTGPIGGDFFPLDDGTDTEPGHEFSNASCIWGVSNRIAFYTADMSTIQVGSVLDTAIDLTVECNHSNSDSDFDINTYFTTATFELKQEPVRIEFYGQTLTF